MPCCKPTLGDHTALPELSPSHTVRGGRLAGSLFIQINFKESCHGALCDVIAAPLYYHND